MHRLSNRPVQRRLLRPDTTSLLERLPDEVLWHILEFSRHCYRDGLPVASRTLRDTFVAYAEHKTRQLLEEHQRIFGRPFRASMMDRYYEISAVMNFPTFKLLLGAVGGVGQRDWLRRLEALSVYHEPLNSPRADVLIQSFVFKTNRGFIKVSITVPGIYAWMDGQKYGTYSDRDAGIFMFDMSSRLTMAMMGRYHRDMTRYKCGMPVVVCGNKFDGKESKLKQIPTYVRGKRLQYYVISSETAFSFAYPVVYLVRRITGDNYLQIPLD